MTDTEDTPQYRAARLRRALAEDPRTAELGVRVMVRGDEVHLMGTVASAERCDELERALHRAAPDARIRNNVKVVSAAEPDGAEELP